MAAKSLNALIRAIIGYRDGRIISLLIISGVKVTSPSLHSLPIRGIYFYKFNQ